MTTNIKSQISNNKYQILTFDICHLIFVLSLLPWVIGLGAFLTPDEKLLFENSTDYLRGLLRGDLGMSFGWGYPGATTMALGAGGIALRHLLYLAGWTSGFAPGLGLADFVEAAAQSPVEAVTLGRLLVVLVVALCLAVFYRLARRLVGEIPAFVAVLLLALDPYVTSYSRLLHNDILMTVFMALSLLSLLVYFRQEQRGYLLLSGAMGGLALVTKTQALYLPAFVVAAMLWRGWRHPQKTLAEMAAWLAIAALLFWACWPAMWADPLGTLSKTAARLAVELQEGYGNRGVYFMGAISDDPGPLYYPVMFAFKGTPLLQLGLIAGLLWLFLGRAGKPEDEPERATLVVMGLYTLFYILAAFVSAQKSPRYFLPAYPALALLTARGLLWSASAALRNPKRAGQVTIAALLVQGALTVALYHPYYLTYYNPLFGGAKQAAKTIMIGWGEGLDEAARYLNGKPGAEKLSVASWYEWDFGSFFKGKTCPLVDQEAALRADYVVFYASQVQRLIPDEHFVSYFRRREPERVITIGGVEYAWIYAGPLVGGGDGPPCPHPLDGDFGGLARLTCYEIKYQIANDKYQETSPAFNLTLYWQALGPLPRDVSVFLRLRDAEGNIRGRSERMPLDGLWPIERWEVGSLIRDDHLLTVEPGLPPGDYSLEVGLYDPSSGKALAVGGGKTGPEGGLVVGVANR